MLKRELIIDYFKDYESFSPNIIHRELKVPRDSNFIISIIGPRRAGKTYYLFQLSQSLENPIYLNFEDSRLHNISFSEIRDVIRIYVEIYGKEPRNILLDEIQNIEKWEIFVREIHDLRKYNIFITGSSSKLLSKEIATQLRGRTLSYLLLPFSFREFLIAKNENFEKYISKDEEAKIRSLLKEYLEFGGFPDVVLNQDKIKILREYSDLILFRDLIDRHKLKNVDVVRLIYSFITQNFSKEISVNSIFNKIKSMNIKVSKDTAYKYIKYFEDTVFFFFVKRFSRKVHLRESWPKKIYLCDTGIVKTFKFSEDMGKLMENCVFLDLLRKTNENPLIEIYYLKINDSEIDFVIKEGLNIKQLIQVTYASSKDEIENREIKALLKASDLLKCKDLLIITWDYEDELKIENKTIKCVPLWKWLITYKI